MVEFIIKVVAGGFFFTPNAYVRGAFGASFITVGLFIDITGTTGSVFIVVSASLVARSNRSR